MHSALTSVLITTLLSPVVQLPTAVWQVAPLQIAKFEGEPLEMKITKTRAALLVPGLLLHPIRPERATRPEMHDWVTAKADLVQQLSRDFDVYAFGYAQTLPVDAVAISTGLHQAVEKLRLAKYEQIVVISHSAGGIIARHYVDLHPNSGIKKVIQVGSPNAGSELANLTVSIPKAQSAPFIKVQVPFLQSLSKKYRAEVAAKELPGDLEFCCVVCKVPRLPGDTMVSLDSQWPAEFQKQGIPATLVSVTHFEAMKAPHSVQTIVELARENLVRWTPEQVEQGRSVLFGRDADAAAVKTGDRPFLRIVRRVISP